MPLAHILGLPLEESLPALGGAAGVAAATSVAVWLRGTRRRLRALARRR
jgi:hypothetical protein